MTRVEVIRSIGEVLRKLDGLRRNRVPDDPTQQNLDELRKLLARQQLSLAINHSDEDTTAFRNAIREFEAINAELTRAMATDNAVIPVSIVERLTKVNSMLIETADSPFQPFGKSSQPKPPARAYRRMDNAH